MRVEGLYNESRSAIDALQGAFLVSEAISVSESARKTLAIAAASAFEKDVTEMLYEFSDAVTFGNPYCRSLISERIVSRQYHALFQWDGQSAAGFFANFGPEARKFYDAKVRNDATLAQSVRDFLDLGRLRNEIVHRDYITYSFDKTLDDVINQYRSARLFVSFLGAFLKLSSWGSLSGIPNC
jgi:hypothetical protein